METKELWKDQIKFVHNVIKEFYSTTLSHRNTVRRKAPEPPEPREPFRSLGDSDYYEKEPPEKRRIEPTKKRRGETVTFSQFYDALINKMMISKEIYRNIWDAWMEGDGYLDEITNPGFKFGEESFLRNEFFLITELYMAAGPEGDPRIDLAMMKALFHAGKMIGRLKAEGTAKSDRPSEIARIPAKNKAGYEKVMEIYSELKSRNLSMSAMSEQIQKKLFAWAEKAKWDEINKKKGSKLSKEEFETEVAHAVRGTVYSTRQIKRIIQKNT